MDPLVGSSLINAGAAVAGNVFNWLTGQDTNDENREIMDQQNQWALKMWQLNNEYNSPSAQMARLRAAGINPSLAFSNGADNVSTSSPEMADSAMMRAALIDPNSIAQARLASAQAEAIESETRRQDELQSGVKELQSETISQQKQISQILENNVTKSFWESRYMHYLGDSEYYKSGNYFNEWYAGYKSLNEKLSALISAYEDAHVTSQYHKANVPYLTRNEVQLGQATYENLVESANQTRALISNINMQTSLMPYEARSRRISADASRTSSMAAMRNAWNQEALVGPQIDKIYSDIDHIYQLTRFTSAQAEWYPWIDLINAGTSFTRSVFGIFK